jgi:hypothetical protein
MAKDQGQVIVREVKPGQSPRSVTMTSSRPFKEWIAGGAPCPT